jgi:hypothetical protein
VCSHVCCGVCVYDLQVTKERYFHKPTYSSLTASIESMRFAACALLLYSFVCCCGDTLCFVETTASLMASNIWRFPNSAVGWMDWNGRKSAVSSATAFDRQTSKSPCTGFSLTLRCWHQLHTITARASCRPAARMRRLRACI